MNNSTCCKKCNYSASPPAATASGDSSGSGSCSSSSSMQHTFIQPIRRPVSRTSHSKPDSDWLRGGRACRLRPPSSRPSTRPPVRPSRSGHARHRTCRRLPMPCGAAMRSAGGADASLLQPMAAALDGRRPTRAQAQPPSRLRPPNCRPTHRPAGPPPTDRQHCAVRVDGDGDGGSDVNSPSPDTTQGTRFKRPRLKGTSAVSIIFHSERPTRLNRRRRAI